MDQKTIEEKLVKNEAFTPEEEKAILLDDGPVDGYKKFNPSYDKEEVKVEEKAEEAKKEEPAKTVPVEEDSFVRLERELSKPDGQEDLKSFSVREKAYFHQMKRDKKAKQEAEAKLDAALFRESKLKKDLESLPKKTEDDPIEELKQKDPTDFMTVEDALRLVERVNKKQEQPKEEVHNAPNVNKQQLRYLQLCDNEARSQSGEDYDAVMELTSEIINKNPQYLTQVAQAIADGENPAIKSYELIKKDPLFETLFEVAKTKVVARQEPKKLEPVKKTDAEIKKENEAEKAQKALENNQKKIKTTGHVGSGEDKPAEELAMEEIANMSDREFQRLPRKVRQRYLEAYG